MNRVSLINMYCNIYVDFYLIFSVSLLDLKRELYVTLLYCMLSFISSFNLFYILWCVWTLFEVIIIELDALTQKCKKGALCTCIWDSWYTFLWYVMLKVYLWLEPIVSHRWHEAKEIHNDQKNILFFRSLFFCNMFVHCIGIFWLSLPQNHFWLCLLWQLYWFYATILFYCDDSMFLCFQVRYKCSLS